MDLVLDCPSTLFIDWLRRQGFKIKVRKGYFEALRADGPFWRFHIFLEEAGDKRRVNCEIHSDFVLHFMFLGVDFRRRPLALFQGEIKPFLLRESVSFKILDGFTWWTRKNKAVFTGFRSWEGKPRT